MNPNSMASVVANTKIDEYLELNRMWIADDVGEYVESRSIAYSIKYIKMAYLKLNGFNRLRTKGWWVWCCLSSVFF